MIPNNDLKELNETQEKAHFNETRKTIHGPNKKFNKDIVTRKKRTKEKIWS
jgi:hypothetical protein